MKLVSISAIPPQPWKNGGGLTRELALSTDDHGLIWRLSVADVASAGPFSEFPGLKRVLTVIEGQGLLLRHERGVIKAPKGEPVRFDGDLAIDCDLIGGAVRDFNLIYDPARARMDVAPLAAGLHEARGLGLLAIAGACDVGGFGAVPPGSFLFFESDEPQRIGVNGAALLVTRDQARDNSPATAFR